MQRSNYNIANINLCLETPAIEINNFCNYMWQEFMCGNDSYAEMVIRLVPCADKKDCFSIYKGDTIAIDWGNELSEVPYSIITKALENIVSGYAINQIDKKEMITLHSGAVSRNNKGILVLGESGNGKSTLTLELVANHNWLYLSDEVGLLDTNHIIHPFLKTISCKQMGIVKLDKKWAIREFGCDYQIAVPKERHGNPVQLKAIFFVKYLPEKKPVLESIKKSDSLVRLLNSQIGRAKSVATVEQMAEVVKGVNSYQLFHNNATEAASLITELVEKL